MASLFQQNVVAIVWDFDKTLTPSYMQRPLFAAYDVDEGRFWQEVRALPDRYREQGLEHISEDTMYLNHLLTWAAAGRLAGLDNARLRELGAEIELFPGLPDFFATCKAAIAEDPAFTAAEVRVEHYIVSNGLREMILGSPVAAHVHGVWACEFIERPLPPGYLDDGTGEQGPARIAQVGYVIDNTTKTRAIFEINKGSNVDARIGVNDKIDEEDRRIPFRNMIYVADGPSDIPVFSLVASRGGRTCAVYARGADEEFANADELREQGRVDLIAEADYRADTQIHMWLTRTLRRIAEDIAGDRSRRVHDAVRKPPASY